MIRVLLVDDHPVVRAGYARLLELDSHITVVAEADCVITGYITYLQHLPDVTVTDMAMPHLSGLELLRKIMQRDSAAKVLMSSMYDSPSVVRSALEGGALGFVTKNSPPHHLATGVKAVYQGQRYLSDDVAMHPLPTASDEEAHRIAHLSLRELEIWRLLALGCTAAECAQRLNLSLKTVANNQTQIKEKLAVSTTAALVHMALRHQLIERPLS